MVSIYNLFMEKQGRRLDTAVKGALPQFSGIYGVVLLMKDLERFETLYVIGNTTQGAVGMVSRLEQQVNLYLPPELHLPGDRGIRFMQAQLNSMRGVARHYVEGGNYHLIIANEGLRGLLDGYVNPKIR